MKIKGAIFDLDGTILDSMGIWNTLASDYLISKGIVPKKNINEKFKTLSMVQGAELYQREYGLCESTEEIISEVNSLIENYYCYKAKPKKFVPELLDKMMKCNIKMCIATATEKSLVEATLKRNNILQYFSNIVTCGEVGYGKDSPVIFEKALFQLAVDKSEAVVFEDSLHAVETAKKAGFKVIGVYDASSDGDSGKIKNICDQYIVSFEKWSDKNL